MLYWHPEFPYKYARPKAIKRAWLQSRGYYIKLARYSAAACVMALLGALNIAMLHRAVATPGGYDAAHVLGQPDFTSGGTDYGNVNAAGLDGPSAAAADPVHHRLFVGDPNNNRVLIYDTSGGVSDHQAAAHVLGQADLLSGAAQSISASTFKPSGLTYDSANKRLYVSDAGNNRVLEFDLSGGVSDGMAAAHVLGQSNFSGSGHATSQTSLNGPGGLAYDNANNRLYVSDAGNNRVLEFDLSGGVSDGMAAAHVLGQSLFSTSGGNTTQTGLRGPSDVAFDSNHNHLVVMDTGNNRAMIFDLSGSISDGMAAVHELGQADFTTTNGVGGQNRLKTPTGIAYDTVHDWLFIGDFWGFRGLQYDLSGSVSDGMNASHVLGQVDFNGNTQQNLTQNGFNASPYGMTFDSSSDQLFATDPNYNRLLDFDLTSGVSDDMNASHVLGQADFGSSHNDGRVSQKGFNLPTDSAIDSANHRLFVSDTTNNRVVVYDTSSLSDGMNASHVLGQADFKTFGSGNSAATMNAPTSLFYDSANNRLFVSDAGNNRVLEFDLSGGISDGMAAAHVLGQIGFGTGGSGLSQTQFASPAGLVYNDADKSLFVSDANNNRVLEFDLSGGVSDGMTAAHVLGQPDFTTNNSAAPAGTFFSNPQGLSYDSVNNRLFVAAENDDHIDVFDLSGGVSDQMPITWQIGRPPPGSHPNDMARRNLDEPIGVSYDSSTGMMFVSDFNTAQVLMYNLNAGIWNNIPPVDVLGVGDNVQSGDPAHPENVGFTGGFFFPPSSSSLRDNTSARYDPTTHRLYVVDQFSNRVLAFDNLPFKPAPARDNSGYAASDVLGQTDLNASIGTSLSPSSTVIDTVHHRLFVLDNFDLVKEYDLDSSNNLVDKTMDHYLGHTNSNGSPIGPDAANSQEIDAMAYDSVHDRLYIGDATDNRVLEYDLSGGLSNGMAAAHVLGQANFTDTGCNVSQTGLCQIYSLAYDSASGLLYVGDNGTNCNANRSARVLVFDTSSLSDGMPAAHVIGQPNFTSSLCGETQNRFSGWVQSLAVDSVHHRLFAGDVDVGGGINRVMVFDTSNLSDGMNASHELGEDSFTSVISSRYIDQYWQSTGPDAQSFEPDGLIYDPSQDHLFIEDGWFGRLLVYDVSSISDGENAVGVIGQANFDATNSFSGAGANAKTLNQFDFSNSGNSAFGFNNTDAYDPTNDRLYISDGDLGNDGFDRVMIFNFVKLSSASMAGGVRNQAYSQTVPTTGGQGTLNYSLTSGALPSGLSLNSATGVVSGTTSQSGTFNFTVKVTDDNASAGTYTDSRSLSLNIAFSNGYLASDLLGQIDGGGNPIWNQKLPDNGAGSTNRQGLDYPQGVVMDTQRHQLFVVECSNDRVLEYDLDNGNNLVDKIPDHVIGQPDFTTSNFNGGQSGFNGCASGLSLDQVNDRLFVADEEPPESRVLVFDLSGGISDGMPASYVLGQPDFNTLNDYCGFDAPFGQVTANGLCDSYGGTAYDPGTGLLYVADSGNARVLVFDADPADIASGEAASYVIGQPDFNHDDNNVTQNGLGYPSAMALDTLHHRLFVSDWSQAGRLLVYDTNNLATHMNASFVLGEKDFTSSDSNADLSGPADGKSFESDGIAYDPADDRLFVEDDNVHRVNRVLIFDVSTITDGETAIGVLGQPDLTNSSGCAVSQIADCDAQGLTDYYDTANHRFYLSDSGNNRIMIYQFVQLVSSLPDGEIGHGYAGNVTKFAGQGIETYSLSAGALPAGLSLNTSTGAITGTPTHAGTYNFSVHVVDDNMAEGTFTDTQNLSITIALNDGYLASDLLGQIDGGGQPVWSQKGKYNNTGSANSAGFGYPSGVVLDSVHHRLFVADDDIYRVSVFNLDSNNNLIDHLADNIIGEPNFTDDSTFCGTGSGVTASNGCFQYVGLAYDSGSNQLFVSDEGNSRVLIYDLSSGISDGMAAAHELGQTDMFSGDCNGPSSIEDATTLCEPEGLAYQPGSHRLYVADEGNSRVLEYDLSGGISDGMAAQHVIGQIDFGSQVSNCEGSGLTSQTTVCEPEDLALNNTTGQLFVGDSRNARVLIYDTGSLADAMPAAHVLGQTDFSGSSPHTTQSGLGRFEEGLTVDETTNRLFVADDDNNRVLIYNLASGISDGMNASAVLGQKDFTTTTFTESDTGNHCWSGGTTYVPTQISICDPEGTMSYDPVNKRLYMVSSSDERVMVYDFAKLAAAAPAANLGTPYNFTTNQHSQGVTAFSLAAGSLPTGLSLDTSSGVISGTPTASGTYNFTLNMSDDNGIPGTFSDVKAYSITLAASGGGTTTPPKTTPPKPKPTSPPTTPPAAVPPPIDLDSQPPVASESACKDVSSASAGQVYTFTARDGSGHKVTVLQVGADSIVIDIDGLPRTLHVGDLISQDVNGDGVADICIDVVAITGGKVELKIDRIVFATAPGGQHPSGFGGGSTQTPPAKPHHTPLIFKLIFPWLLFVLLAMSAARLAYQSYRERRLAALYARQLAAEMALADEKNNFVSLSSHYLRTPMTAISSGIELMNSLGQPVNPELAQLSRKLSEGVNGLLSQAGRLPSEAEAARPGIVLPMGGLASLAAGFVKISTMPAIVATMAGTFVLVSLADIIVKRTDIYDVSFINFLIQLAAILALAVFLWTAFRSHRKNQELREQAEKDLAQQRELDTARDTLIRNSLNNLKPTLAELKAKMQAASPANPQAAKPALNGIGQLEGLLQKFTILSSLETGRMSAKLEPMELSQLAEQISARYAAVLQSKGLSLKNQVQPAQLNQDRLLLSFAIDSLLSNAIKYSPPSAEIRLSSHQTRHGVELLVSDAGPGIMPEKQAELFQPFSRAEQAAQDFNVQGVGLSLFLDKLIMGYLGGEFLVDSQPGRGTTIGFRLPSLAT